MKTITKTIFISLLSTALISSGNAGDDTDIYFPEDASSTSQNVLFIMDVSGSMRSEVGTTGRSRFDVMKDSFSSILGSMPPSINVGLMNFGSIGPERHNFAQGVKFPVSPLTANARDIIEAGLPLHGNSPNWNANNMPEPDASMTVFDFLPEITNSWSPDGWTPLVDSLYEAALYYRGEKVGWGLGPLTEEDNEWVAHPSTYTGSPGPWIPAACATTWTERRTQGDIPAEYNCPSDPDNPGAMGSYANCAATERACIPALSLATVTPFTSTGTFTNSPTKEHHRIFYEAGEWNGSGGQSITHSGNDTYEFTVIDTGAIRITLDNARGKTQDPYLYLLDEQNNIILEDDNSGKKSDALITTTLNPGNYKVVAATAAPGKSGTYVLGIGGYVSSVSNQLGLTEAEIWGTWVNSGGITTDTSTGNLKYYFTVTQSGTVNIRLLGVDGVAVYAYLLDEQGAILAENAFYQGTESLLSSNLNPGTYQVVAATYYDASVGDFEIFLTGYIGEFPATGGGAGGSSSGFEIAGLWGDPSGGQSSTSADNPAFEFTLENPGTIDILLDAGNDSEYLYLLNDQGAVIAEDGDYNAADEAEVSESLAAGNYTIVAATATTSVTGDFVIRLTGDVSNILQLEGGGTATADWNKLTICHRPVSDPSNPQTLTISSSSIQTHLGHGDTGGACATNTDVVNVCHIPSGNPGDAAITTFTLSNVPEHLLHGDVLNDCGSLTVNTLPTSGKVDICHIPPGNPDNAHTISISVNAVPAHRRHGDPIGACTVIPEPEDPNTCLYTMCSGGATLEPNYISPISSECQSNTIILLSDGSPQAGSTIDVNATYDKVVTQNEWTSPLAEVLRGLTCEDSPSGLLRGKCGPELVEHLATNDNHTTLEGDQTIQTYTVGLGLGAGSSAENYLKSLSTVDDSSTEGVEGYFSATDEASLVTAFSQILSELELNASTTAFSNPGYSIVTKTSLSHEDSIFIPTFEVGNNAVWKGNLKKFKIVNADGKRVIQGKNDQNAVTELGIFTVGSHDYWSTSANPDGLDVAKGGVASRLDPASRNLYVDLKYSADGTSDLTDSKNALSIASLDDGHLHHDRIQYIDLGLEDADSDNGNGSNDQKKYICFIQGYETYSVHGNQCIGEARKHMGDMLHFEPLVVTYNKDHGDTGISHGQVIFTGTNEGYLHAFDTDTGEELFAFMPRELLKNIKPQFDDNEYRGHKYGVDGFARSWIQDNNGNGVIEGAIAATETTEAVEADHVYLYFGLRRGGHSYYALDITDPTSPKLKWKIQGGSGNFEYLGESWSRPYLARMHDGQGADAALVDVLIFTGGNDVESTEDITEGSDIIIVNAENGEFIWSIQKGYSSGESGVTNRSSLTHSIPGGVRILDIDKDGAIDRMYFADLGGNVWRLELDADKNDTPEDPETRYNLNEARLVKLSSLGGSGSNDRKFYNEPDVSLTRKNGQVSLLVSIGSGDRTAPLNDDVTDRFYVLVDQYVKQPRPSYVTNNGETTSTTIIESDLAAVTIETDESDERVLTNELSDQSVLSTDNEGWYYQFESGGEKVLSNSITSHGKVIFTTLVPDVYVNNASNSSCNIPATQGRAYVLDILEGKPAVDLSGNGGNPAIEDIFAVVSANEIPGQVQLVFNEPSAANGGACVAENCIQNVDVRSGKKLSQIVTYNGGVLESIYWTKPQEKQ